MSNTQESHTKDSLVERLDPAIGEASAGIGVMLSELVRRTLRGGVAKVEEEMDQFVEEKVELTVAQQMPRFEQTASKMAESTARDVASNLVQETEEKLTTEIHQTREEAQSSVNQTKEQLASEIAETERRAEEKSRSMLDTQIESLKEKSYKTYENIQQVLGELKSTSDDLQSRIQQENQERQQVVQSLLSRQAEDRQNDLRVIETLKSELAQLQQKLVESSAAQASLESLLSEQRSANYSLAQRIDLLEAPKGLKALWNKMTKKDQKNSSSEDSALGIENSPSENS